MIWVTLLVSPINLQIDKVYSEDEHGIEKEIYESQGDFCDVEDNLIGTHLHVATCLHVVSRDDDWHRANIFHIYVTQQ